jgi:hypothetical protein
MVSSNTRERLELVLLILNANEPKHASLPSWHPPDGIDSSFSLGKHGK